MLGMTHAIKAPPGLVGPVLADGMADTQQWLDEADRLRSELPIGP